MQSLLIASLLLAICMVAGATDGPGKLYLTAAQPSRSAISAEDLLGLVDIGASASDDFRGMAISPDQKFLALQTTQAILKDNSYSIRWLLVPLGSQSRAIDIGDGGDPIPLRWHGRSNGTTLRQVARWTNDSKWIIYRRSHRGQIQIWRSGIDGHQEQLTNNASDIKEFLLTPDGKRLLYAVGPSRANLETEFAEEQARGLLFDERFVPLYGRLPVQDEQLPPYNQETVWAVELESKRERKATAPEIEERKRLLRAHGLRAQVEWRRISKDGRVSLSLEDLRADKSVGIDQPLTLVVQSAGSRIVCEHPACTGRFKGIWLDPRGESVTFLRWRKADEYSTMAFFEWDVRSSKVRELLADDALIEACSEVPPRFICTYETPTIPKGIVAINLRAGTISNLYDPNPKFRSRQFGDVVAITWRDKKYSKGFGHLVKPVGYELGKRYPLVIVQYISAGFLRGGVGDEYPIHLLSAKGFMVLSFHNPRVNDLFATSRTIEELVVRSWRSLHEREQIWSVLDAGIEHLIEMGVVDADRIGISGLSDGANTGVYGMVKRPGRFAAAALSYTYWNPINFYLAGPKLQPTLGDWGFGDPALPEPQNQWARMSLALNAERFQTPLLVQVSDQELLPETQTFAALRAHNKPVEIYVFMNEGHIKSQPRHRYSVYRRSVQWFQFWLQGIEDSNPIDHQQYARWRRLQSERASNKSRLSSSSDTPWTKVPAAGPTTSRSAATIPLPQWQ